jgi:rare lipoprotein A
LALLVCVASLGAAQGPNISGADHRSSPAQLPNNQEVLAHSAKKKAGSYQIGTASWYGEEFDGKETASGVPFDMYDLTAAHPSLPLGTYVKVTNLHNKRSIVVQINDRGPVVEGRIIDLSYGAAKALGFESRGVQRVRLDLVKTQTVASLRPVAQLP